MKNIKKFTAIVLVLAMVLSFAACGDKVKTPSAKAGTEKQQEYTKKGYDLLKELYGNLDYKVTFSETCYLNETKEPQDYGLMGRDPSYKNIVARILYVWVIQGSIPMYTVVFIDADGNPDYYTYIYEETAKAAAEEAAKQVATYEVMYDKLVEFQYNEYLEMNDTYIPKTEQDLAGWTQLDISHLL